MNVKRRSLFLLGATLIPVGAIFLLSPAGTGAREEVGRRTEPLEWGFYQILWSRAFASQLARETARFASKPDYVMFFRDLGRPFPRGPIDAIESQGATAVVSWELWLWHGGRQTSYLPAIVSGAFDDFFRKWATDAERHGRRVLVRFGFEFNGDWFSWAGQPEAFVAAWRRIHDIFRDVGARSVEWVWAPNHISCPDTPENDMHRYYPGDDYVDWIGVDGYNFGAHHDRWHTWQRFEEVFSAALSEFATRYPNKPVMITEFGCAPDEAARRVQWIRDAYGVLDRNPQVKAAVWFNYDKRRENEPNWRIDATPGALRAFNETFAAPRHLRE